MRDAFFVQTYPESVFPNTKHQRRSFTEDGSKYYDIKCSFTKDTGVDSSTYSYRVTI